MGKKIMLQTFLQTQKLSRAVLNMQKLMLLKNVNSDANPHPLLLLDRGRWRPLSKAQFSSVPVCGHEDSSLTFRMSPSQRILKCFLQAGPVPYEIISVFWYLCYLHHSFGMRRDKRLAYLLPFWYCSWLAFHLSPGFIQSCELSISSIFCAREALLCVYYVLCTS